MITFFFRKKSVPGRGFSENGIIPLIHYNVTTFHIQTRSRRETAITCGDIQYYTCTTGVQNNSCSKTFIMQDTDVFYKLVKSQPGAQYDPKIGMFRSYCLKVYGMYHTLLDNIFCRFTDMLENIFNCYMIGVWLWAVNNRTGNSLDIYDEYNISITGSGEKPLSPVGTFSNTHIPAGYLFKLDTSFS